MCGNQVPQPLGVDEFDTGGGKCSKIKLLKLAIKALRRADSGDSIFMNCI